MTTKTRQMAAYRRIGLAVFDLDGTLIDSREDLAVAVNHALEAVHLPQRSVEEVVRLVGDGAVTLMQRALGSANLHLTESALEAWRAHYSAHLLDRTVLYPGIAEVLAWAKCKLAVQTNKPGNMARRILQGLGVADRFLAVCGGDDAPRKPDPAGIERLMALAGVGPADTVLVGDSLVDLETARAAGVEFVAVTWGYVPEAELVAAGARNLARTAAELLPWVKTE